MEPRLLDQSQGAGPRSHVPTLLVEKQTRREMYQESETDAKRPVLKGLFKVCWQRPASLSG